MAVSSDLPMLPGLDNRLTIVGQSGSGKSVAGAHHLLRYREEYREFPWVIFNPKEDRLLDSIGAERLDLARGLPKNGHKGLKGGLFIVHPVAETEDDAQVDLIIEQAMFIGGVGLYFDEGYSIPKNSRQYRRALTQGRSKKVPVITLSQRPVLLDKFAFTEASFFRAFYLFDRDDRKKVQSNTGIVITDDLPDYESYWYEVKRRKRFSFAAGPNEAEVLQRFRDLKPAPKRPWWKG